MKIKSFYLLPILSALLLSLFSCSDLKQTKNLYGEWWPVHASGNFENEQFTAKWDGDLGIHGDITVTYVNKKNAILSYDDVRYYPMICFSKKQNAYCTITIQSLGDMRSGKYLNFEVKDGKVFYEKADERGIGTGEFDEGHELKFLGDDVVRIGGVTYERYAYFKSKHPEIFKSLAGAGFNLTLPID